jgi:hypothetical protein
VDAPTPRAHRSLEIAARFPQRPQRLLLFGGPRRTETLVAIGDSSDTDRPTRVAGFQTFGCGRFSTFGDILARRPSGQRRIALLQQHPITEFTATFSFLLDPDLDATNWRAGQALRPAVVTRKNVRRR